MTTMQPEQWMWFLVGFVPYYLAWRYVPCRGWVFEVRAIFWRLRVECWPGGVGGWMLRVPLIEHLKGSVWAVVLHLAKYVPK
jgi:hypothetical protein